MNSHRPGERAGRGEAGFTLVELLLAIVISAIITGAIGNAIIVGLKTTGETENRLGQSRDTQLVANWLQVDVASAAPSGISITSGAASGCSGTSPGTNLAVLPYAAGPGDDAQRSAYRLEPSSGSTKKIVRYHCVAGGTPERIVVATEVTSATAALSAAAGQVTVTFTVNEPPTDTFQATMFKVSGHNRTGTPDTTPQSTAPTPTTAPPAPCAVDTSESAALPNPVTMASSSTLSADVNVLVTVTGSCTGPLTLTFSPGSTGPAAPVILDTTGAAVLGQSAYSWTTGSKLLTIKQDGGAGSTVGTLSFTVNPQPCTVSAVATPVNPTTVGRVASGGKKDQLLSNVTVTVTSSGVCSTVQISYVPKSGTVTQGLTSSGPNTWTASIPGTGTSGAVDWNPGSHAITVIASGTSYALPGYTLAVT